MWSTLLVKMAMNVGNVAAQALRTAVKLRARSPVAPNIRLTGLSSIPKLTGEAALPNLPDYAAAQKAFEGLQPYNAVRALGNMLSRVRAPYPALQELKTNVLAEKAIISGPKKPLII